jgi:hypothetical protein
VIDFRERLLWGHEDAFPPTTPSNRSRLGKPTFAGMRGNEQDAPIADLSVTGAQLSLAILCRPSNTR